LASDILAKSFEENAIAIRNAKNQSVILDDLGITTTN
jgi:DNA-directed RNA polymerase subunit N (RpoN/RPB10)